jgi:signal transduction histidine kinase/GAF domain-containing protein
MEAKTQTPTLEESTIVERVARIVSSIRATRADYTYLAAELEPAIPFDVFGIVLLRHDRQALRVTVCKREELHWTAQHRQHPLKDSKVEQLLQHPMIMVQNYPGGLNGSPAQSGDALSTFPHLRAILIAPLIVEDQVLGTLELGSTMLNVYADVTLQRLIKAVARVLAAAIESAQVGGNVEIQDRQRQALKNVSSALTSEMDLSMILNRIVAGVAKSLHVASAIVTLDQRQQRLHLAAQSGLDPELLSQIVGGKVALSDQSILGSTLRYRQPWVSHDIGIDERFPASHLFASELAIRSIFSYPLVTGERVYGALLLCSPEPGGFTPLKADILSLFASQATVAIHNGMLLESVRQRRRFQEVIEQLEQAHTATSFANAQVDEQVLLERVRQESMRTYGVSFSTLLRFLSDHLLTRNERDLQDILRTSRDAVETDPSLVSRTSLSRPAPIDQPFASPLPQALDKHGKLEIPNQEAAQDEHTQQDEGMALLIQTAEAALAQAGVLSNVGAALANITSGNQEQHREQQSLNLQLYEHLTRDTSDGWFIVDPQGYCIYVNPAAEAFCGMRMTQVGVASVGSHAEKSLTTELIYTDSSPLEMQNSERVGHEHTKHFFVPNLTLKEMFSALLSRARNIDELRFYLQDFTSAQSADISKDIVPNRSDEDYQPERPGHINSLSALSTLRCIFAAEPLASSSSTTLDEPTMLLESAPSDRHYQFTRYPLFDQHGQLVANALQVHDITEQVRDEKNKSVLLSSISHDLRTPLTTIKAAVTGLLQPDLDWDDLTRREILEEINAETDNLTHLVNAVVEMSRIEMGALVLEKEWCDVVEIAHGTLTRFERTPGVGSTSSSKHTFSLRAQPQLPLISADYVQLERVFSHLIENAIHYSPDNSEILVTLDLVQSASYLPGMLRVQVIDSGSGIPESERERIFKTFYTLDSQGSGLGLAICRGIIEAHGGRIWVESPPGGGSCFVFVLPIHS